MRIAQAKFSIGDLIQHLRFDYRGVIVDVDQDFNLSEDWYQQMAKSQPPKDKPWYHVLVHDAEQISYVAERNLIADDTGRPVRHPLVAAYFINMENGAYQKRRQNS